MERINCPISSAPTPEFGIKHHRTKTGFTLIEVLMVVAIMVVVLALSGGAIGGIQKSFQLSQVGTELRAIFAEARLTSISTNRLVEVRLGTADDPALGDFACLLEHDFQGVPRLRHRLTWFPPGIGFRDKNALSTLFANEESGDVALPRLGTAYQYSSIVFRPDGTTNLPEKPTQSGRYYVTLAQTTPEEVGNFYVLEINPFNGAVRAFRP